MPVKAKELKALDVKRLTEAGVTTVKAKKRGAGLPKNKMYAVGGVDGLGLQVTPSGGRSWILRYSVGKDRRGMGLGSYPTVGLADAQKAAREARELIRAGKDPINEKRAQRSALVAAQGKAKTFKDCAELCFKAREKQFKNAKHGKQWLTTLETYVYPTCGQMLVGDIDKSHLVSVLEPIWTTKAETARRVRGRIENVFDWANAAGYRQGDNPARLKGSLQVLLGKAPKKVKHHTAIEPSAIFEFMKRLRKSDGMGPRALEFAILTAARSGEVRGATWDEINPKTKVWTVPADRMKANKEHQVPLSDAAIKLLEALPRMVGTDFVFPAPRGGSQLSDATLSAVLKRMNVDAVPHGFRSTFRDWAGETTAYPREVIEHALAHQLKDKAEAAYARGTLFAKRKLLMADWATFCATTERGNVLPFQATSAAD